MRKLACMMAGAAFALWWAAPVLADDNLRADGRRWEHDRRDDRHDRHHDRLEDRHEGVHDRLEERHNRAHDEGLTRRQHRRLHNRLERGHDRAHGAIEDRHDEHHDREEGYRYGGYTGGYPGGYGYSYGYDYRRGGYGDRYNRYGLRGDGWAYLGWVARDPRLASWVLRNFDHDGNGGLGMREAEYARHGIYRMADRNRDGRLSRREIVYWQTYVLRD